MLLNGYQGSRTEEEGGRVSCVRWGEAVSLAGWGAGRPRMQKASGALLTGKGEHEEQLSNPWVWGWEGLLVADRSKTVATPRSTKASLVGFLAS